MLRGGHEDEQRYKNRDYQHRGIAAGGDCGEEAFPIKWASVDWGLINQGRKTFCPDSMRRTLDRQKLHRLGLKWEEGSKSRKEKRKGQSGVWYNGIEFDIFYIYFDIVQWKDVKHSSLIWHIPFDHLETFLLIILQLFCLNINNVLCNHRETFLFIPF